MSTPIEDLTAREMAEGRKHTSVGAILAAAAKPVAATAVSSQPVEVPKPAVITTGVVTSAPQTPSFLQHLEDEIKEKLGK